MALRPTPDTKLWLWSPSPSRLSMVDREEIRAGLARGETLTLIAATLGRAISTVSREVANNGGRRAYRAVAVHRRAAQCARRPKRRKLDSRPVLVSQVEEWLIELWSPEQNARRLRHEFPGDPMMQVSHGRFTSRCSFRVAVHSGVSSRHACQADESFVVPDAASTARPVDRHGHDQPPS